MARIPDTDLQRLKEEVSVQLLVEASGVELKKGGKDFTGKCPFHADDTASLVITPHKNLWHCFGCQVGGGPIDWVMKLRGVSFLHAVELLKEELAGSSSVPSLAADAVPVKRSTVRALPAPVALDAEDPDGPSGSQALLAQTLDYYHQRLKESPEALAYLKARGLDPALHPTLIDAFKLGVADRTLGLRLPEKNRKDGAAIRERLQRIGLIRESGHEHFNGSLVVPVFDADGNIAEVYGRKLRDDLRPGTPKHLYQHLHPGAFSLRTWLESGEGNLYLTWREDMLSSLKPLVSGWVDILIAGVLTLPTTGTWMGASSWRTSMSSRCTPLASAARPSPRTWKKTDSHSRRPAHGTRSWRRW